MRKQAAADVGTAAHEAISQWLTDPEYAPDENEVVVAIFERFRQWWEENGVELSG